MTAITKTTRVLASQIREVTVEIRQVAGDYCVTWSGDLQIHIASAEGTDGSAKNNGLGG